MINEELLSILLGREVEELRQISNMIHYEWVIPLDGCIFGEAINIYEVAYKCKEWALSKGYYIVPIFYGLPSGVDVTITREQDIRNHKTTYNDFSADTEDEAIFKACEWILNEMEQEEAGDIRLDARR